MFPPESTDRIAQLEATVNRFARLLGMPDEYQPTQQVIDEEQVMVMRKKIETIQQGIIRTDMRRYLRNSRLKIQDSKL